MKFAQFAVVAAALAAVVGTHTGDANAAVKADCVVSVLSFDGRLIVTCSASSIQYYALPSSNYGSTCYPATVDTIKVWQSMVQSAELSGRKIDITYATAPSTCSGAAGVRAIQAITLLAI